MKGSNFVNKTLVAMIYKISLCILVALCATIGNTNAQDGCVPLRVDYVYLQPNGTLTWEVLPDEACVITDFLVYIDQAYAEDETEARVIETTNSYVDVSFLHHCRLWNFSVVAVSYTEKSDYRRVFARVPLREESDLAVRIVSVTESEGGVLVLWQPVNDECADRFRVEYRSFGGGGSPTGLWSFANYVILRDVPFCSRYEFTVRAFHGSASQVEGPLATAVHDVPPGRTNRPRLTNLSRGATYINTTWALDDYAINRCQITTLRINGAPNFAVSYPIQDTPTRLPVNIQILNLRPETLYVFRTSVINEAGESDVLPVAVQTTSYSPDAE